MMVLDCQPTLPKECLCLEPDNASTRTYGHGCFMRQHKKAFPINLGWRIGPPVGRQGNSDRLVF